MDRILGVNFGGDTLGRSRGQESNCESEVTPLNDDVVYLNSLCQDEMIIDYILKNFEKVGVWDHPAMEIEKP